MFLGYLLLEERQKTNTLDKMKGAMSYSSLKDGEFFDNGLLSLFFTGEDCLYQDLNAITDKGELSSVIVFFSGIIYNKKEILKDLFNDAPEQLEINVSESMIVAAAYKKWGDDCFSKIIGDWVCLVFNEISKKIILCKDHYGVSLLYYHCDGKKLIFTDSLALLIKCFPETSDELNIDKLIALLSNKPGIIDETYYTNIKTIPSSHYLILKGESTKLHRYWNPYDKSPIFFSNVEDYYESFLEIFEKSIKDRLQDTNKAGIFLSSGLDSSSIAVLASKALSAKNKSLYSYTSIPEYGIENSSSLISDESYLVSILTKKYSNIEPQYLSSTEISPFDVMQEELERVGEPLYAAGNLFWIRSIFEKAKADGIDTLLIGQNGNTTISWPYQFVNRNFQMNLLKKNLFALSQDLAFQRQRFIKSKKQLDAYTKNLLINNKYLQSKEAYQKISLLYQDQKFLNIEFRKKMLLQKSISQGLYWKTLANSYGIRVCDPTTDPRLIEYCIRIPYQLYYDKSSDRAFIRNSMKKLLPEEILINNMRGLQSADLHIRLLPNREIIESILKQFKDNSIIKEIMNLDKMEHHFKKCFSGSIDKFSTIVSAKLLLRGLMIGIFILRK